MKEVVGLTGRGWGHGRQHGQMVACRRLFGSQRCRYHGKLRVHFLSRPVALVQLPTCCHKFTSGRRQLSNTVRLQHTAGYHQTHHNCCWCNATSHCFIHIWGWKKGKSNPYFILLPHFPIHSLVKGCLKLQDTVHIRKQCIEIIKYQLYV